MPKAIMISDKLYQELIELAKVEGRSAETLIEELLHNGVTQSFVEKARAITEARLNGSSVPKVGSWEDVERELEETEPTFRR